MSTQSHHSNAANVVHRITNYKAYLGFISCLMVLSTDGQKYLDTARETLDGLASRFGSQERAPLLAQLEINRRLREAQLAGDLSGAHGDDALLLAYWEQFGHKGSVLDDLGRYVDGQSQLVGVMKEAIEGDAVSPEECKGRNAESPADGLQRVHQAAQRIQASTSGNACGNGRG